MITIDFTNTINNLLDQGYNVVATYIDLTKAFDMIDHDMILIHKLSHLFSFSIDACKLIWSYLTNRTQRTRFNNCYSSTLDVLFGVPQVGLGPGIPRTVPGNIPGNSRMPNSRESRKYMFSIFYELFMKILLFREF